MSSGVLAAAVGAARRSAAERARRGGPALSRAAAAARPRAREFADALRAPGIRVIAECKRRSPSRGILRRHYDAAAIARGYERNGAAAISVLTEPTFFDGHVDDLRAVRAAVSIPVLRKDFIVSEFQIVEARACGADAVLLIVAALADHELTKLLAAAARLEVAALVETHTLDEVTRAENAGAEIVGVNSRNLTTLRVSPAVFDQVAGALPPNVIAVAESGITAGAAAARLHRARYDAFLVGERFMTAPEPGAALAAFIAEAQGASA